MRKTACLVLCLALLGYAQSGKAQAIDAATQCSAAGTLDQSCITNGLADNANIFVPAGIYNIAVPVTISRNNVSITCAPGAVFSDRTSGSAGNVFSFTGQNPRVVNCEFVGNPATRQFSLINISGAASAIFRDDRITDAGAYAYAFLLRNTTNALVDNLTCPTCSLESFGPSSGLTLTHGILRGAVFQSPASSPGGNTSFTVNGTHFVPSGNGAAGITVQDASHKGLPGYPNLNFTIKGTTTTLRGSTAASPFFGCWSIVSANTENGVFSGNTCNADGQYISFALLELGTNNVTVTGNNLHAVDAYAQNYRGIISYGSGNDISQNEVYGWGANSSGIQIYPNADNHSVHADRNKIEGNILTYTPASTMGSPAGVAVSCNVRGGSALDTVVRGNTVVSLNPGVLDRGMDLEDYTESGACPISGTADENTIVNASIGVLIGQASFSVGQNSFAGVRTPSALRRGATFADTTFVGGTVSVPSLKVGVGNSSGALSRYARYTAVLSPPEIAGHTCAVYSAAVSGIEAGDVVLRVLKPSEQAGLWIAGGRASAPNTVAIQFCNDTLLGITPTPGESYTVVAIQ